MIIFVCIGKELFLGALTYNICLFRKNVVVFKVLNTTWLENKYAAKLYEAPIRLSGKCSWKYFKKYGDEAIGNNRRDGL